MKLPSWACLWAVSGELWQRPILQTPHDGGEETEERSTSAGTERRGSREQQRRGEAEERVDKSGGAALLLLLSTEDQPVFLQRPSSDAEKWRLPWHLWASRNLISGEERYVLHVNSSTAANAEASLKQQPRAEWVFLIPFCFGIILHWEQWPYVSSAAFEDCLVLFWVLVSPFVLHIYQAWTNPLHLQTWHFVILQSLHSQQLIKSAVAIKQMSQLTWKITAFKKKWKRR